MRFLVTSLEYRRPLARAGVRLAAAIWLFVLGAILCAGGYWWGALLMAVAVLVLWIGYRVLMTGTASPRSAR